LEGKVAYKCGRDKIDPDHCLCSCDNCEEVASTLADPVIVDQVIENLEQRRRLKQGLTAAIGEMATLFALAHNTGVEAQTSVDNANNMRQTAKWWDETAKRQEARKDVLEEIANKHKQTILDTIKEGCKQAGRVTTEDAMDWVSTWSWNAREASKKAADHKAKWAIETYPSLIRHAYGPALITAGHVFRIVDLKPLTEEDLTKPVEFYFATIDDVDHLCIKLDTTDGSSIDFPVEGGNGIQTRISPKAKTAELLQQTLGWHYREEPMDQSLYDFFIKGHVNILNLALEVLAGDEKAVADAKALRERLGKDLRLRLCNLNLANETRVKYMRALMCIPEHWQQFQDQLAVYYEAHHAKKMTSDKYRKFLGAFTQTYLGPKYTAMQGVMALQGLHDRANLIKANGEQIEELEFFGDIPTAADY
jgi:hypothetical protein